MVAGCDGVEQMVVCNSLKVGKVVNDGIKILYPSSTHTYSSVHGGLFSPKLIG